MHFPETISRSSLQWTKGIPRLFTLRRCIQANATSAVQYDKCVRLSLSERCKPFCRLTLRVHALENSWKTGFNHRTDTGNVINTKSVS